LNDTKEQCNGALLELWPVNRFAGTLSYRAHAHIVVRTCRPS